MASSCKVLHLKHFTIEKLLRNSISFVDFVFNLRSIDIWNPICLKNLFYILTSSIYIIYDLNQ